MSNKNLYGIGSVITYAENPTEAYNALVMYTKLRPYEGADLPITVVYVRNKNDRQGSSVIKIESTVLTLNEWQEQGYPATAIDERMSPEEVIEWAVNAILEPVYETTDAPTR